MVLRMKSVSERDHSPPRTPVELAQAPSASRIPEEEAPHQESEWKDLVYETAPLACLNFDIHGRILDFNLAAARLLGLSAKRDFHRPLAHFFSPRHHRRLLKHIRQSIDARVPVTTRIQLRADNGAAPAREIEMTTRPVSEALCYRTRLLPISGTTPFAWPSSDAKFRALVENSSEVVCIGAPDGTIFYTTPSVRRVLGYEPALWFGRNAFEVMHPEDAGPARAALRQLAMAPTGSVINLVTRVRHRDGSWKWVEAVLTNLIGQPDIGGIVCNYRDVTDSRRAEEALRLSEQRYRLLAESLPNMICVRDEKGRVLYCNSHWCQYRGVCFEDATKVDWTAGIPHEDLMALTPPPWVTGIRQAWEGECRFRRASDGEYRWHVIRILPLPDETGSRAKWIAITTDIHERKQAEQERERLVDQLERERSELAVQYAVVRVLAWASSLAVAAPHLIDAFCTQLGWQAGALWTVGNGLPAKLCLQHIRQRREVTPAGVMRQSRPAPLKKGQGLAGRVWAGKKPLSVGALSTRRGLPHHRAAAGLGLRGAFAFPILLSGQVRGVVELFTRESFKPGTRLLDIVSAVGIQIGQFIERTHALDLLRQSEEALIQVNNALEQRVKERTAELHDANRELSAEIVERTRLEREIICISEREQRRIGQDLHDGLCQELAAIAFMTGALATRMGRNEAPEAERIRDVSLLLNESIARCRDIARGLHPVEMDADGLMVALNDLARHTSQSVPCTFRCDEPILMPESDMALNLYRIAQEAVNNALKYSRATRITISLDRQGAALRLSVSDNGRGLPASGKRRRRTPARGMGLHIMRYRARTMGATLHVRERRPHGTQVLCFLPSK
jgi:PAS domain S-box-containing protein